VSSVFTWSTPLWIGVVGVVGVTARGVAGVGTVPPAAAAVADNCGLLQQTFF
jgi:hypothetical protein